MTPTEPEPTEQDDAPPPWYKPPSAWTDRESERQHGPGEQIADPDDGAV